MPIRHRSIPTLPNRPRVHPIAGQISRSYPVGRQSFSRGFCGAPVSLTISSNEPLPESVLVRLETDLGSAGGAMTRAIPFVRADDRTLVCRFVPERLGLHSFRAKFSPDGGVTWLGDTVPDAWILIDPPQVDGLRIYSLVPNVSGTMADWIDDLPRIRDMGFNAIHLLPITALDSSQSPYAARDLFHLDHSYVSESNSRDGFSQLAEYVEQARAHKIMLCFDLVLNHVGIGSAIARKAPDWIVPDQNQPDGLMRARYWSTQGWRTWDDLVLINYEHPSEAIRSEIRAYMTEYALFWANYANDSGGFVRFDNLHSSNPEFVEIVTAALQSEYPKVGILAEYFTDERTMLDTVPKWGLNLVLATPWTYKFVPQLRDYVNYIHRVSEQVRYFMPITSHDSGAPAQEFGTVDSTAPRYVAAALLGTGATGMPEGVEYGEAERIDFIGRKPKIRFPAQARFADFIAKVNEILTQYPAFRCGQNCQFVDDGHDAILAAFRRDSASDCFGFLVACNFDTFNSQRIAVNLEPFLGTIGPFSYSELLSGADCELAQPRLELLLPPCGMQVLRFLKTPASSGVME